MDDLVQALVLFLRLGKFGEQPLVQIPLGVVAGFELKTKVQVLRLELRDPGLERALNLRGDHGGHGGHHCSCAIRRVRVQSGVIVELPRKLQCLSGRGPDVGRQVSGHRGSSRPTAPGAMASNPRTTSWA